MIIGKIVKLGVLAGALLAVDLGAKAYAEGQLQEKAQRSLPGVVVDAEVTSFPFLPRLLTAGTVAEVDFSLRGVDGGRLSLSSVDISLNKVKLDRSELIQSQRADVIGIDRGTVAVELTAADLTAALGQTVEIEQGEVRVLLAERAVAVTAKADGSSLVLAAANLQLTAPLPKSELLPCFDTVTVLSGRLRVACQIEDVPPGLFQAV